MYQNKISIILVWHSLLLILFWEWLRKIIHKFIRKTQIWITKIQISTFTNTELESDSESDTGDELNLILMMILITILILILIMILIMILSKMILWNKSNDYKWLIYFIFEFRNLIFMVVIFFIVVFFFYRSVPAWSRQMNFFFIFVKFLFIYK